MNAPKVELLRGLRQEVSMEGLPDCSMPWPRPPPAISPQLGLMNQETTVSDPKIQMMYCNSLLGSLESAIWGLKVLITDPRGSMRMT